MGTTKVCSLIKQDVNVIYEQECILVGYVLHASVAVMGVCGGGMRVVTIFDFDYIHLPLSVYMIVKIILWTCNRFVNNMSYGSHGEN